MKSNEILQNQNFLYIFIQHKYCRATQTSKEGLGPSLKREFLWWKPRMYGSHHHRHMTTKLTWHTLEAEQVMYAGFQYTYIHTHHAILIFPRLTSYHKNPMALGGGFIKTSTPPKLQGKSHTKDPMNLN